MARAAVIVAILGAVGLMSMVHMIHMSGRTGIRSEHPVQLDALDLENELRAQDALHRQKTIVFIGTSFTRAVYFEGMRQVLGRVNLTKEEMYIPSYSTSSKSCNLPGKAGVDLAKCGSPGFSVVSDTKYRIMYHFKTYLYAPEGDDILLERILSELNGTTADLLVLGSSEWGMNKYIKTPENLTTREGQAREFYLRTLSRIPAHTKLFLHNKGYNSTTKALYEFIKSLGNWKIFDYTGVRRFIKENKLPNGHGWAGWGTETIYSICLKVLEDSSVDLDSLKYSMEGAVQS